MDRDEYEMKYHRESWMSADQFACAKMVADVFGGFHHVTGNFKPCGKGVEVSVYASGMSTFDFDRLTRLVLLAHDRCIRVELAQSGRGRIKLLVHQRHARTGCMSERHPRIEDALAVHRRYFPAPPDTTQGADHDH